MAYKFSETGKLNDEFRSVFGIGFKPFYDWLISVAAKCLCIDIMKFDEWLHQQHGNYEDESKSMDDIIREHYGEKGVELINEVTDMGDFKLTDGIVSLTGLTTVADRTVCKETVTYRPHGRCWDGEDVNAIVYDLMIIAAYDMLAVGKALYGGEYTAAEMAGKIGYLHQYVEGGDYKVIKIETKTFCCTYHVSEAFAQMAEWEGVMNLQSKKCHRFTVEGKELPKGAKIEPYKRCCGYKPTTVSLAAENNRLAKKFDVIGAMSEDLGSEGMKRALSVLTAIKSIKKLHGYDMGDMADRMLRRKLWRDYGKRERLHRRKAWLTDEMKRTDQGSDRYKSMKKDLDEVRKKLSAPVSPVCYTARDFEHGPEVWKQVDEAYVKELIAYFRQVLADHPAPEWPKQGDVVQFKNREKMQKKYQGKFLCEGLAAFLSLYFDRIEWRASLCVGKFKNEYFLPGQLEPAPEKPKKKPASKRWKNGAGSNSSEREQARPKVKAKKADVRCKKADVRCKRSVRPQPSSIIPQPSDEQTLAERLRQALLKQMRQAA